MRDYKEMSEQHVIKLLVASIDLFFCHPGHPLCERNLKIARNIAAFYKDHPDSFYQCPSPECEAVWAHYQIGLATACPACGHDVVKIK